MRSTPEMHTPIKAPVLGLGLHAAPPAPLTKKFKVLVEMEILTADNYNPTNMESFQQDVAVSYNGTEYQTTATKVTVTQVPKDQFDPFNL